MEKNQECVKVVKFEKEPWESGLIYIFAKDAGAKPPRGFESLRLRKFWVRAFPRKNASARSAGDAALSAPNPNPARIFHAPRGSKSMVRL